MTQPDPNARQFPPQATPPGAFHAPPPRRKSTAPLILALVGGALALCCGGVAVVAIVGGDDKPTGAAAATDPAPADPAGTAAAKGEAATKAPPAESRPGLKDPVRDGKFEFVVTKLDCGKTKVGSKYLNKKAQGKFCLVDVTVRNIGDEAQLFDGSSQKALDADGTEYSNDGAAELYANEDNTTFLNEINPGNQVKGRMIFDVPKATKLTAIELHDSPFSGGVKVALS